MCKSCTRKGFKIKTGDQVDDTEIQPHLSMENPSVCFNVAMLSQEVGKLERADFFHVGLGQ